MLVYYSMVGSWLELTVLFEVNVGTEAMCDMSRSPKSFFHEDQQNPYSTQFV